MQRIPRQELLDQWRIARAYAEARRDEPHARFVSLFRQRLPHWQGVRRVLDLGCGTAGLAIRFACAFPQFTIDGVDTSYPMLAFGEQAVQVRGLRDRIRLQQYHLPSPAFRPQPYDIVISDGLLHHLADPMSMWNMLREVTRPGSGIFVIDLIRPQSETRARELATEHAGDAGEVLQQDLYASLLAAYTIDEVRTQLRAGGLGMLAVEAISDLHLLICGDRLYRDDPIRPLWAGLSATS